MLASAAISWTCSGLSFPESPSNEKVRLQGSWRCGWTYQNFLGSLGGKWSECRRLVYFSYEYWISYYFYLNTKTCSYSLDLDPEILLKVATGSGSERNPNFRTIQDTLPFSRRSLLLTFLFSLVIYKSFQIHNLPKILSILRCSQLLA